MTMNDKNKMIRILLAASIFCAFGVMFTPFFTPILMAALFAFALDPLVARYSPKRSRRRVPIALLLVFFFLISFLPIGIIGYRLMITAKRIGQTGLNNTQIFKSFESLLKKSTEAIDGILQSMNVETLANSDQNEFLAKVGTWFVTKTAELVSQTPQMILSLFIFSASLCFFLAESKNIRQNILKLSIVTKAELDKIIRVVQRSSYITLVAQAVIGAIQALIVALGGLIFGYYEFMLLFVITFFTSLIPVVGASPIAIILAIFSLAQGEVGSAIGLGVVAIVAGTIDNILKPYIVSQSGDEEINPVIALVAIIGAVIVYGLPGLLLGPILTTLAVKIVPILFGDGEISTAQEQKEESK